MDAQTEWGGVPWLRTGIEMCYCNKLGKKWRGYRFSIAEATKKEKTSHACPKSSPFLYLDAVLWAVPASEAFAKGSAVIGSLTTRVSCQSLLLDLVYRISPKGPFKVLRFSGQIMPDPTVPFDPSGIGGAICQRLRDATRFVQNQDIATLEIEYGPLSVL